MNKNTPRKPYVSPDTNVTAVALESAICDGSAVVSNEINAGNDPGIVSQEVNTEFNSPYTEFEAGATNDIKGWNTVE